MHHLATLALAAVESTLKCLTNDDGPWKNKGMPKIWTLFSEP